MTNSNTASNRILTPSNVITITRICLVPVFVVALLSPWPEWFGVLDVVSNSAKSIIACIIFVLISCTDWLDGYLARSRNEVTDFGKFADPLADKILVIAALLALVELQVLPSWPVLIIITREFIVSGIRMIAATKGHVIAASWYGKAKTVTQIIAIVLFLLKDSFVFPNLNSDIHVQLYIIAWIAMALALILTIISMLDYIVKAWPMFSEVPSEQEDGGITVLRQEIGDLATRIVKVATEKGITLSTAESLTGGMISTELTSVPGSSSVFKGAVVSYDLSVKSSVLDVDEKLLEIEGAVNAQTAQEMARGARARLDADVAVSATGIAGPSGAEPGKPVGTVFLGIAGDKGSSSERFVFEGDRQQVRLLSTKEALRMMLAYIDPLDQG